MTDDFSVGCVTYGLGNFQPNSDPDHAAVVAGYTDISGKLTAVSGSLSSGFSGSFTIDDLGGYDEFLVVLKAGNVTGQGSQYDPDFAVLSLIDYALAGDLLVSWSIAPDDRGELSHLDLYGRATTAPVPLPAAAWLLLGGMGGLGLLSRKRRST